MDADVFSVAARIQGHPSRVDLHERLLADLAPMPVEVSLHASDPPNPWEGYKLALRSGLDDPAKPTHVLVLQDDVVVCRNFPPAVTRIVEARPDDPVCLFLSWLPPGVAGEAMQAAKRRELFLRYRVSKFVPAIAIIWPRDKAEHFLEWSSSAILPGHPNRVASDDACIAEWHRRNQTTIWATVPSLVQHPDEVESLIGKRAMWGKDRGRTALYYIGDGDPLGFQW